MFRLVARLASRPLYVRELATASKTTKIGIVGCGNVGSAVSRNLLKHGFPVVAASDKEQGKLTDLPEGIKTVSTSREVGELSDVIITGLPRPPDLKAMAEGPDGLLAGMGPGKVWIDHSTTDYHQTIAFNEEALAKGGHVLEAPITGGLEALKKGQMVAHIGGDKAVADAMMPILQASFNEIFYVGEIGSAMLVKVVSNMLAGVHIVAMAEALMLAKRSGLDLKRFWDAIRVSAGNSFVWETGAPVVFNGTYDPGFPMELLCKDLQLGYDMAKEFRVPMEIHQLAFAIYRRTQYQMGDDAGCYSPPKTYELALDESLNIPGFENWSYDNEIHKRSLVVSHSGLD
ncbi:2-hydroxy-3-oxopropionate reductase-like [Oratosquilla oratoria]|uniref:2-hydroxy-3-oxopropionate reductase-like n=1 Tax=Oratosquilla oratoria TaxID=337810 RepID=UPI003F76D6BF